jgi:Carbohydrate-binding module 48 (Isoamylase N-terminal domain)
MSMSAERDDALDDEVLRLVVSELLRPVQLDPSVDRRALDQIRAETTLRLAPRSDRRWGAWLAGAAAAAGVLLAVALPDRQRPAGAPASAVALEGAEASSDARPVRLRLAAPTSSRVAVVGDFNDWDPAATPLHPAGDGGTWIVELRLKPGRYHYTFLIDGRRWARDPSEPPAAESDFGAPVSVLTVS